jgi:hypothetical protein
MSNRKTTNMFLNNALNTFRRGAAVFNSQGPARCGPCPGNESRPVISAAERPRRAPSTPHMFFVEFESVKAEQLANFVLIALFAMMFLLIRDVTLHRA